MKHLLTLSLFLVSIFSYCQNLTMNEVVELRKKGANEVINTLEAKGWEYDSFRKGKGLGNASSTEFSYLQGKKTDPAQVIESNLIYYFFNDGNNSRVIFTTFNPTKYKQYMNQIINVYKCKKVYEGLTEKTDGNYNLTVVYQGATTTFMISLIDMTLSKDKWKYSFTLVSNKDYNENLK